MKFTDMLLGVPYIPPAGKKSAGIDIRERSPNKNPSKHRPDKYTEKGDAARALIISHMQKTGFITLKELVALTGRTDSVLRQYLKSLISLDKIEVSELVPVTGEKVYRLK